MTMLLLLSLLLGGPTSEPRTLAATRTDAAIAVDGRLDEPAWAEAETATNFVQFEPDEGAPASRRTEVRVLYGPAALYVGAVMYDEPDRIRRPLSRRDDTGDADYLLVGVDGYLDRRTGYAFGVTAAGVQFDAVLSGNSSDFSWDAVWDAAVRVTEDGWIVEMEIPYSMLRFSQASEQTWGVQFERRIARNDETAQWEPVTRAERGGGLIFGRLTGIRGIEPRRTLQVRPYALSRVRAFEDAAAPGTPDAETGADVGADLKVGLASNLILDATINPDFGQVEADPAVLNLSTFETFFDERRPFFLEGTTVFDYGIDSGRDGRLLYTRRIGAFDPIIAATKLTGRSERGLSVGALASITGSDLDPERLYAAGRLKQELGERSYVGSGLTYFDGPQADGRRRAVAGGGDFVARLAQNTYQWDGTLTLSHVDAPGERRTGFAFYSGFDKIRGTATFGSGVRVYSDDFHVSDVGRLNEVNLVRALLGGSVYLNGARPFGPVRRADVGGFGTQTWRYSDGTNRGFEFSGSSSWELMNFSTVNVGYGVGGLGGVDVRETRGLGPVRNRRTGRLSLAYETDARRRFVAEPSAGIEVQEGGGLGRSLALEIDWNASDRVALELGASYGVYDDFTAWAANETFRRADAGWLVGTDDEIPFGDAAALDAAFAGVPFHDGPGRYIVPLFGTRDTREFDVSLRTNVVFRPNLSLQLYSQLFAARGRYRDFRLLAAPDDLRDLAGYPKRRDLSLQSLVSNAVLRWEYRPGSALYVVWSHHRGDALDVLRLPAPGAPTPFEQGTFDHLGDTFGLYPENVLLVKLSYLLMR